jgi:hypothetical protein
MSLLCFAFLRVQNVLASTTENVSEDFIQKPKKKKKKKKNLNNGKTRERFRKMNNCTLKVDRMDWNFSTSTWID